MNGPAIITSTKKVGASPPIAFLLSFLLPGLGQLYNGDPLRGFVYAAIRIISLIAIPLPALRGSDPTPVAPMALAALHLATQLASAADALVIAFRGPSPHAPRFRAARWFAPWTVIALLTHALSYVAVGSFFTIRAIAADGAPLCSRGDLVLVRRHVPGKGAPGDLLITRGGEPLRIIAIAGDQARYESGVFTVNGTGLSFGKIEDNTLRRMMEFDRGDIMSERNGDREYAIRFNREGAAGEEIESGPVPDGNVLAASDNRTRPGAVRLIPLSAIAGKAEGILYSSRITRTGLPPWTAEPSRGE